MSFDETDWLAYRQANLLFAEAVKSVVNSGDVVWVQGELAIGVSVIPRRPLNIAPAQTTTCASYPFSCGICSVGLQLQWGRTRKGPSQACSTAYKLVLKPPLPSLELRSRQA